MSTWLDTIMTPLNAANQSVQKLIEIRDAIKFGEEVGKLHSQILTAMTGAIAAKADQATLLDEIGDLKKKVAELEGWETDKEKYELIALAPYVMAFRKKQSLQGSDPPYYICATCYNAGKKTTSSRQFAARNTMFLNATVAEMSFRYTVARERKSMPLANRGAAVAG